MGFVAFVLVVGGLGFLGFLVWSQLRTQNRLLEQLLGVRQQSQQPVPVEQPSAAVMPVAPTTYQPWPQSPSQVAQDAAFWAQRS